MPQADLPAYYASADLFVGPSIVAEDGESEGLPVVLIEAMAAGCPAVGSQVGGINEAVSHGRTGLLIQERDAGAIAGAICDLLGDKALRERLRDEALLQVRERFDQQVVAERYAEVILGVRTAAR